MSIVTVVSEITIVSILSMFAVYEVHANFQNFAIISFRYLTIDKILVWRLTFDKILIWRLTIDKILTLKQLAIITIIAIELSVEFARFRLYKLVRPV